MEQKVSEVLENILGFLALSGSFDVEEKQDFIHVSIDTEEAGKLIGAQGETLSSLQLIVNLICSKQVEEYKKVIVDVAAWRQSKEEELAHKARMWANKVVETNEPLELDPMPSWQRRIVHITIQNTAGVESESIGEGPDRHLIIKPSASKQTEKSQEEDISSESKPDLHEEVDITED